MSMRPSSQTGASPTASSPPIGAPPRLTRRRFVQALAGAAVTLSLASPPRPSFGATGPRFSDADALVDRVRAAMNGRQVPGAAVGLYFKDAASFAGIGLADRSTTREVDADTGFAIASITKTYTAMAAMQLVEQGRLRLDTPVRRYLPGLRLSDPAAGGQITMRHLLTHTAGLARDAPSFWPKFGEGDDARVRMLERFADVPQRFPVGGRHAYSNIGIDLAARVIEVAAGTPIETLVRSSILQPLMMDHTGFFASDAVDWALATGWGVLSGQRDWPAFQVPRFSTADSGLVSTVRDQLRYARFWLRDGAISGGSPVLSEASLDEMLTPQADTTDGWIGLGWFIDEIGGVRVISHSGLLDGFASRLTFVPSQGFALVVLINGDDGSTIPNEVTDWALSEYLGLQREA